MRQKCRRNRRVIPNPQHALKGLTQISPFGQKGAVFLEQAFAFSGNGATICIGLDPARTLSQDQGEAECRFKLVDRSGDGGRRDVQLFCGTRNVPVAQRGCEVSHGLEGRGHRLNLKNRISFPNNSVFQMMVHLQI